MKTALALVALSATAGGSSLSSLPSQAAGFVRNGPRATSTFNRRTSPLPPPPLFSTNSDDYAEPDGALDRLASSISRSVASKVASGDSVSAVRTQLKTLIRVGLPSIFAGVASYFLFPVVALAMASLVNDSGVFAVLSQDSSQFVQNFLTVSGLLFSILVGQSYSFMYTQQESVYYALFEEVTEAKSLLEQVALVCQGRSMYQRVLACISSYVADDLRQLQSAPARLLSSRPVDDPLESIMYLTSVGVPSNVYETVRSLRQARARRLGALQRKLPPIHMLLLWILAAIELGAFPLLGAGTQTIGGYNILTIEGALFGVMTFGIVMTLRVVGELWRPAGGAYNVDGVLSVMISGLEEELEARMNGFAYTSLQLYPSASASLSLDTFQGKNAPERTMQEVDDATPDERTVQEELLQQGADGSVVFGPMKRIGSWAVQKLLRQR